MSKLIGIYTITEEDKKEVICVFDNNDTVKSIESKTSIQGLAMLPNVNISVDVIESYDLCGRHRNYNPSCDKLMRGTIKEDKFNILSPIQDELIEVRGYTKSNQTA